MYKKVKTCESEGYDNNNINQFIKVLSTFILIMNLMILCKSTNPSEITACLNLNSSLDAENVVKLIDILPGSKVHLFCHYCDEEEDYNAKLWYYRSRRNKYFKEIKFNNNNEDLQVSLTPSHTLNINSFGINDSGIYACKNVEINKIVFTYAMDGIFNDNINVKIGTIDQWQEYKRTILDPINDKFKKSQENTLKNSKITNCYFNLITIWDDWGLCQEVKHQKGLRTKVGRCRLHTEIVNNNIKSVLNDNLSDAIFTNFFTDGYDHSCRSIELNKTLPEISRIIRNIPEYTAVETCFVPQNAAVTKVDNNDRGIIKQVAENSHITLVCSELNNLHDIRWFKNNKNNLGVNEEEPHLTIDIYNSLHILHVTKDEEGNYTCSVNDKQIRRFEVKVVSKIKTLNQEFIRYSIYLGFVLSLTITCYCTGVCVAWHRKASFADPLNLSKIKTDGLHYERVKLLE